MLLDLFIGIVLLLAFFSGYKKGIIFMLFFIVGISLGVAASLKLSYITANYLHQYFNINEQWLPVISFLASFLVVFLLARFVANLLEKVLSFLQLNFINKIIGGSLGLLVGFGLASIAIWYGTNLNVLQPGLTNNSIFYPYLNTTAPFIVETVSEWLPYMKSLLADLQLMFTNFAENELNAPQSIQ